MYLHKSFQEIVCLLAQPHGLCGKYLWVYMHPAFTLIAVLSPTIETEIPAERWTQTPFYSSSTTQNIFHRAAVAAENNISFFQH
jgi:hypothetical protein